MNPHARPHAWTLLAAALLILGAVTLQTIRFHDRPYRQDEINTVHAAQVLSLPEVAQWMARMGVHPAGWRMLAAGWVKVTGIHEGVTRALSMLCTMIALALVFRLAQDLFEPPTGLYALLLLGALPFAMFYMRELRPYPQLVLVTAGLHLTFLRWLRAPGFKYALLYVAFGMAGLQTHYFVGYVLAAQAVGFVMLVRWNRGLYLRAFGLFFAIALSFIPWLLPLAQRLILKAQGLGYTLPSNLDTLRTLDVQMQILPRPVGHLLLLVGLLLPAGYARRPARTGDVVFRVGPAWRKAYLLLIPACILILAWIANLKVNNLTARNLLVMLPTLVILAALALRRLPWQARWIAAALIVAAWLRPWPFYQSTLPYREVVAFIDQDHTPGDKIITEWLPANLWYYALLDWVPGLTRYDVFNIHSDPTPRGADPYYYTVNQSDEASVQKMVSFLGEADRVWYIRQNRRSPLAPPFIAWLEQHFAAYRRGNLQQPVVTEYRRLPADLQDRYHFGSDVHLLGWTLPAGPDVKACQPVEVETWWQASETPTGDYGIDLVLAEDGGLPVARIDAPPTFAPTSQWTAGLIYLDTRALAIPCDLPPGDYALRVGLYDSAGPLAAAAPDGTPAAGPVYLATLVVTP